MQFNAPIGIQNKPYFAEGSKLSSARDNRNVSLLWKKVNQDTRQQTDVVEALSKMERQIAKMRRMIKGGYMPQDISVITPFQIYNITNTTNGSDSWRTYQIRDGFVSARSKYWLNQVDYLGNANPAMNGGTPTDGEAFGLIYANNEYILPVIQDVQGFGQTGLNPPAKPNNSGQIVLSLTDDTLICGYDSLGNYVYYSQIVMGDVVGQPQGEPSIPMASFWIEIVDDKIKGFYVNLWGRMCGQGLPGQTPAQQTSPFPLGKNIIPIGIAVSGTIATVDESLNTTLTPTGNSYYYQMLCGLKTIPEGLGATSEIAITGANNVIVFRGEWTGSVSGEPLSGQVFYPGDMVLDDSRDYYLPGIIYDSAGNPTGEKTKNYGVYIYKGNNSVVPASGPYFETDAPHLDLSQTKWQYLCNQSTEYQVTTV